MLLYSTILDLNDRLTKEEFVRLVIDWNQQSRHEENRVPGLDWDGQNMNVRFGNDDLWLRFEDYRNGQTIAARYERKTPDGIIWDTDIVMNYAERRIAIRLDRSYTEDAVIDDPPLHVPYIVAWLIERGYLSDDHGFVVDKWAQAITADNADVLASIITDEARYALPIVYISRTADNEEPVRGRDVAGMLKGATHVLAEDDISAEAAIAAACENRNPSGGEVGIYLPNGRRYRLSCKEFEGKTELMLHRIGRIVLDYMNARMVPPLYTWSGVIAALLRDRWQSNRDEKRQAESDLNEYIDMYDEEMTRRKSNHEALEMENADLQGRICSLEQEVAAIRNKLSAGDGIPLLTRGNEMDLYPDEVREIILDILQNSRKDLEDTGRGFKYRREDVLEDILEHNEFHGSVTERRERLKKVLTGYRSMDSAARSELKALGLEDNSVTKHHRLTYYGDDRYHPELPSTGSDGGRGGKNSAAQIIKLIL